MSTFFDKANSNGAADTAFLKRVKLVLSGKRVKNQDYLSINQKHKLICQSSLNTWWATM